MYFQIVGLIERIEVIASGSSIRNIKRLQKFYGTGTGKWKKMKGVTTVRLQTGKKYKVELHWYEAHGIGKKEPKIKRVFYEIGKEN